MWDCLKAILRSVSVSRLAASWSLAEGGKREDGRGTSRSPAADPLKDRSPDSIHWHHHEEMPPSFHFPGGNVVASRIVFPLLPGFRYVMLVGQMRGRERVSGDSEPEAARTMGGGSGWLPVS